MWLGSLTGSAPHLHRLRDMETWLEQRETRPPGKNDPAPAPITSRFLWLLFGWMQGKNNPLLSFSELLPGQESIQAPRSDQCCLLGQASRKIQSCLLLCLSKASRRIVDGLQLQVPPDEGSHQNNSKWSVETSNNIRRDNSEPNSLLVLFLDKPPLIHTITSVFHA